MTVFLGVILAMLVLVMVLIFMNLYEIFEEPAIEKRMQQLRKPVQPWITVLLYARDNEATIEAALNALVKNKYYNYDIVVVNDRSKDRTLERINSFLEGRSKIPITVVNRRKKDTAQSALDAGYRKSKHGKIVISLRATTIVSPGFIKRAVAVKNTHQQVTLRLRESSSTTTLGGIANTLSNFLWLQTNKAIVSDPKNITLTKLEVRPDFIAVLLLIGIVSVSILTKEAIIIWYSWIIVTSYLVAVIWLNSEGLNTKLKLSFSAVSALFLLPVSSCIQAISQSRSRM